MNHPDRITVYVANLHHTYVAKDKNDLSLAVRPYEVDSIEGDQRDDSEVNTGMLHNCVDKAHDIKHKSIQLNMHIQAFHTKNKAESAIKLHW